MGVGLVVSRKWGVVGVRGGGQGMGGGDGWG